MAVIVPKTPALRQFDREDVVMFRVRGEELWIGDDHVANVRLTGGDRPFAVQLLNGEVCHQAETRRAAELWVRVHGSELLRVTAG
ncbi:hypothetical protein [Subtercola sp. YIM 133946]|uniref:hypothetical protein n=1 Tax=Subtercola sp. YIM 133946 TaxID=3118909 RepID=UPI002F9236CD